MGENAGSLLIVAFHVKTHQKTNVFNIKANGGNGSSGQKGGDGGNGG